MELKISIPKVRIPVLAIAISYFFVIINPWGWNMILHLLPFYMVFIAFSMFSNNIHIKLDRYCFLLFIFAAYTVISCLFFANLDGTPGKVLRHVYEFVIALFFISYNFTKREISFLIKMYSISALFVGVKMLLQGSVMYDMEGITRHLIENFGKKMDPNYLSACLLFAGVYFFYKCVKTTFKIRYVILFCIPAISILATGSRGGLLSLAVGCGIIFIGEYNFTKKALLGIVLITICIFLYQILPDSYAFRYSLQSINDSSNHYRVNLWKTAFAIFLSNPIFGRGGNSMLNYAISYGAFRELLCHNTYLAIMADYGIIGAITFFSMLVGSMLQAVRKKNNFVLGILFATGVCGIFICGEDSAFYWQNLLLSYVLLKDEYKHVME